MPKKIDFKQWEYDNNISIKWSIENFLKETTKEWRQVFWFDVYNINNGVIKNIEPGFDTKGEKTPAERLDIPLNNAVNQTAVDGSKKLEKAEESDQNVKFIMGEEDLIPPARV